MNPISIIFLVFVLIAIFGNGNKNAKKTGDQRRQVDNEAVNRVNANFNRVTANQYGKTPPQTGTRSYQPRPARAGQKGFGEGTAESGSMKYASEEGNCAHDAHAPKVSPKTAVSVDSRMNAAPTSRVASSIEHVSKKTDIDSRAQTVFSNNPVINGIIWGEILKRPAERRAR